VRQRRQRLWEERFAAVKNRLREPMFWFPFPLLISFMLVLLLTSHVLFGTNPRTGQPADVLSFPAKPARDSAIWFSVTPIGGDVVVATNQREVFRWRQDAHDLAPLKDFVAYLRRRVETEVEAAVLQKAAGENQANVVIAADQRLKFLHMRPILHALAEAGIAHYSFETQQPVLQADAPAAHEAPAGEAPHGHH
jgi:hypothetical protein